MITVEALPGCSRISVVSEPIRDTSSSFTILMTIWPGFSPFITSWPMALSSTDLMNCFTTLKLTSASKSAIFTSFKAVFTSSSVSLPLLRKFLNTFCNLSVKLSNATCDSLCFFIQPANIIFPYRSIALKTEQRGIDSDLFTLFLHFSGNISFRSTYRASFRMCCPRV